MCVATSSTALYKLFDEVRVVKVEVWSAGGNAATTGLASNTVTISFPGQTAGVVGDAHVVSGTSLGIEPCHFKAKPSPRSGAAFFQPASSAVAFFIEGLQGANLAKVAEGTIIDVTLQLRTNSMAPVASSAGVGLTTGSVYFRGLDGNAVATTLYLPIVPDEVMA